MIKTGTDRKTLPPSPTSLRAWLVVVTLIAIIALAAGARRFIMIDDAFITLRYARNLSQGMGFVYNPGEHVLGATMPFYAALVALPGAFGADILNSACVITTLCQALAAVMLFSLASRAWGILASAASALAFIFHPAILDYWGNECLCFTALLLLGIELFERRRLIAAGTAAGLLFLVRGEGAL